MYSSSLLKCKCTYRFIIALNKKLGAGESCVCMPCRMNVAKMFEFNCLFNFRVHICVCECVCVSEFMCILLCEMRWARDMADREKESKTNCFSRMFAYICVYCFASVCLHADIKYNYFGLFFNFHAIRTNSILSFSPSSPPPPRPTRPEMLFRISTAHLYHSVLLCNAQLKCNGDLASVYHKRWWMGMGNGEGGCHSIVVENEETDGRAEYGHHIVQQRWKCDFRAGFLWNRRLHN